MKETKFKDTEIGLIPEGWDVITLGDCVKIVDGTHQTPHYVNTGGVSFYSVENITTNNFVNTKRISLEEHNFLTRTNRIEKGDILMTRIGSIGNCKYIDWDVYASFYVSLALLKDISGLINMRFLSFASKSKIFQDSILSHSLQFAIPLKINLGEISKVQFLAPTQYTEQLKIASALTSVDNLISSLDKLIAKKKDIKQGTMQQLLTGKKRLKGFTEPWVEKSLSEIGFLTAGGTPSTAIAAYWNGCINWLQSGAVQNNIITETSILKKITKLGLNNSAAYLIKKNSILIAITGATCANIGYLTFESAANQSVVSLEPFCAYHPKFLYFKLLMERNNILSNKGGSAQSGVTLKALKELHTIIPADYKEQSAIASVLTSMDNEISALEAKKAKYENIKQGMMQQLLTGKIRLID